MNWKSKGNIQIPELLFYAVITQLVARYNNYLLCLLLDPLFDLDDALNMFLRNAGTPLIEYTVSEPRTVYTSVISMRI